MSQPLDLRELFALPWSGAGEVRLVWWLRWLPVPKRFSFRSEIRDGRGDDWEVVDTTTRTDGRP
jgi:hypothetical protein